MRKPRRDALIGAPASRKPFNDSTAKSINDEKLIALADKSPPLWPTSSTTGRKRPSPATAVRRRTVPAENGHLGGRSLATETNAQHSALTPLLGSVRT